jgi:hypothetical protein
MEVVVGSEDNIAMWNIPKALLSHHSEFFRVACNGPFKEGLENKIILSDINSEAFQDFVHWMYFGNLPRFLGAYIQFGDSMLYSGWTLWIFGDRILAGEFKNTVMRDIHSAHTEPCDDRACVYADEARYIWSSTVRGSLLRVFFLDAMAQTCADYSDMEAFEEEWDAAFIEHPDLCRDFTYVFARKAKAKESRMLLAPVEKYLDAKSGE